MRKWVSFILAASVVGIFGGWLYLGSLFVPGEADAQVRATCGPGANCRSRTFTATIPGSTSSAVSALNLGQNARISFNYPTSTYQLWLDTNQGRITMQGGVRINSSIGLSLTGTVSGSNAVAFDTSGARLDLGAGSSDYLYSDGTNVCLGSGTCLSGTNVPAQVIGTKTVDIPSIAPGGYSDFTLTVGTVALGDQCIVGGTGTYPAGLIVSCFVADAASVTVRAICSNGGTACDPAAQTWLVRVFRN